MMDDGLAGALMNQPLPLKLWLAWLVAMNLFVPLVFIRHVEARVIAIAFVLNAAFMSQHFASSGYGPHLGLSHVIFWTPLMLWLVTRLEAIGSRGGSFLFYVYALIVTNAVSLGIDYVDVVRAYVSGR